MSAQPARTRRSHRAWRRAIASAALLLLVALMARAIGWGPSVINPDESIFSLAAREVVAGHLPYLTLFDNKPVGSTLILAAAFATFGQTVLVARLLGALFAWAAGVLVAALLRSSGFSRTEALIGGIIQIAFSSAIGLGGQATLTELMFAPFTILAALLVRRLSSVEAANTRMLLALAAGLACGVAVLIKIVPILPGLAIAGTTVFLLVLRRKTTATSAALFLATFVAGAVAPMLAAAGVYVAAGEFDTFWWSNFGFAGAYAAIHPKPALMVQRLATVVDTIWPLLLLTTAALLDAIGRWRRGRDVSDVLLVVLAWLAAELVAAAASLQFFPHYFIAALPPLVLLAAFGLRAAARWIGAARTGGVAVALGGLIALIAIERTQVDMARERLAAPDIPRRVANAIHRANGGPAPSLLVTNYKLSGIYLLTGSPLPPTRFAVPAHLFSRQSVMTRADPRAEVARVIATRPEFIVFDDVEPLPRWAQAMFAAVVGEYRSFYTDGTVRVIRHARAATR